ncbi:MAG: Fe-S cluster assembly protein SufD, partial [Actinomycetes bacterium]
DGSITTGDTVKVSATGDPGVQVETVSRSDSRLGQVAEPADVVAARAWSSFSEATVVTVAPDTVVERPTVLEIRGSGSATASYGHVFVDVGAHATATVVLDHVGSATYADNLEVRVGPGASLTLVSLQSWDDDTVHLGAHHLRLGRDATLTHLVVTLGGRVVRLAPTVDFTGPGASVDLIGAFFTDPGQHHEHRLFVDHDQPQCRSNVSYKGALQGDGAHSVWIGDVLIRANAVGTETYEINRNLLLTKGARADSVPNLEIETGDVASAGHASATGRFDDDQLFYLMARGISEIDARRLVVRGFFADLVARIEIPEVRARLDEALESELNRSVA